MVVLPILGQLADKYGRKPLLILTLSITIVPFVLLAINESKASVYAYYVLRTISYIISQGSIFYIFVAYVADVVKEDTRAALFSWIAGSFLSHMYWGMSLHVFCLKISFLSPINSKTSPTCSLVAQGIEDCPGMIQFNEACRNYCCKQYYLKAAFGFNKNQFSEILMTMGIG